MMCRPQKNQDGNNNQYIESSDRKKLIKRDPGFAPCKVEDKKSGADIQQDLFDRVGQVLRTFIIIQHGKRKINNALYKDIKHDQMHRIQNGWV